MKVDSKRNQEQEWNKKHLLSKEEKRKVFKVFNERIGLEADDYIKRHLRASPPELRNASIGKK